MKSSDKRSRKKPTPLSETNATHADRAKNMWDGEEIGDEVVRDGIDVYGADGQHDMDDQDDDNDGDDDSSDMFDEEVIDEESRAKVQAKAANFDSDSASNSSPLVNQKKVRALRHANTLAADDNKRGSQSTFDNEMRSKPARGNSNIVGIANKGKKAKFVDGYTDNYDVQSVVDKMLYRKDRKIPGSVYKPHSAEIILLQSVALGQP